MAEYRLIVDFVVIECLDTFTAKQRRELFGIIRRMLQNPNEEGD